jgi:hypothetical protein
MMGLRATYTGKIKKGIIAACDKYQAQSTDLNLPQDDKGCKIPTEKYVQKRRLHWKTSKYT